MRTYTSLNTRNTPVSEPILGENQIVNNTGGYVYELDPFKTLERFLILGSEGGSYYVAEKELTRENAKNVIKCIEANGKKAVDLIVNVSDAGRALKNDPALFALALAASAKSQETRVYALAALPKVARIPTHLFHFLTYVQQFRGWGRSLKRAVADWYNNQPVDRLAYQVAKYQSRDGFSNRDALRLAHPKTNDVMRNALYKWIVDDYASAVEIAQSNNAVSLGDWVMPPVIAAFEEAKFNTDIKQLVYFISNYNLSREMLPTEALKRPEIWEALLEKMPYTAMIRNLGNMSKVGLLKPLSAAAKTIEQRLLDREGLKKARVHPIALLMALKQYGSGAGFRGTGQWTVVPSVVDALDDAFYLAFDYLEPTGKRFLFGVDVSGSMSSPIMGLNLSSCEAAAAMALACAKTEREYYIMGFAHDFRDLGITAKMRLTEACAKAQDHNFGSTRIALPAEWALKNRVDVDAFVIITDNDVNTGGHPKQALQKYRDSRVKNAKQIIMATSAYNFSVADPNDPFSLDIVGFDANVPVAIQEFVRM
jgi:60 kDa SS-A/Ro ribonucleoprotein